MDSTLALLTGSQLGSSLVGARVRAVEAGALFCDDGRWADRLDTVGELVPGDEVVLAVLPGRERPVVLGRIGERRALAPPPEVVIAAGAALTLRCGGAGITLRADGRILIDGLDIASRAKRLNRITGGAVAIN